MARKLYDIDVDEITICASTANRKQFFIKKSKEKPMEKFIELIKGFVVDEDDDELTKEEIAKAEALEKDPKAVIENAVNTFEEYKESMPDDLLAATKILVKQATFVDIPKTIEELKKAGAALSKSTIVQLTKILSYLQSSPAAIATLKTLLGQKVEKEEHVADDDGEKLSAETEAKLEKLEEFEKAETERIEKEAKEAKEKAEVEKKALLERLEALEKGKPVKKSIDDKGDGDDDDEGDKDKKKLKKDDDEDNWPSLVIPGME